ncbi:MAG TPA: hypothetical protein VLL52_23845 [Anaerolineae bacterium]|nr:hypothetical protein [Anaerolineae bacterium]
MLTPDQLTALHNIPTSITTTEALITRLDDCFQTGFANLQETQQQILAEITAVFAHTPLHQPLQDAGHQITTHQFTTQTLLPLAIARASLHGALHDALQTIVHNCLQRPLPNQPNSHPTPNQPQHDSPLHIWLLEIALTGFTRLTPATIHPFLTNLTTLQQSPHHAHIAPILTGFVTELLTHLPLGPHPPPTQRWTDLWCYLFLDQPTTTATSPITATFTPLALDLRHHAHTLSANFYGLLTTDTTTQFSTTTITTYRVDAIQQDDIWLLFNHTPNLFNAWHQQKTLQLDAIPATPTGQLLWQDNQTTLGPTYDLIPTAHQWFAPQTDHQPAPLTIPATHRHPLQLAVPLYLTDYTIDTIDDHFFLQFQPDSPPLPIFPHTFIADLTPKMLLNSRELFGLLRYDNGRFLYHPLTLASPSGKLTRIGDQAATIIAKPPRNNSVTILQERASKLLRPK